MGHRSLKSRKLATNGAMPPPSLVYIFQSTAGKTFFRSGSVNFSACLLIASGPHFASFNCQTKKDACLSSSIRFFSSAGNSERLNVMHTPEHYGRNSCTQKGPPYTAIWRLCVVLTHHLRLLSIAAEYSIKNVAGRIEISFPPLGYSHAAIVLLIKSGQALMSLLSNAPILRH